MSSEHRPAGAAARWWLSGTPLVTEHLKLMRGRYQEPPWEQTTAASLTPTQRERAAATWRKRIDAEFLAVSTFSVLSMDMCAARAPADVLSLIHRAAIDEVRHAEYCCQLASIYSGQEEMPPGGLSDLPDDPKRPRREQALANALLVSCVAETYATVVLNAMRDDVTDPVVSVVLKNIYADEVVHARIGWSYLAYCLREGGPGEVAAATAMIPVAIRGAAAMVEGPRVSEAPLDPELRAHGLMTADEERVLFARAVHEVLLPGFRELGLAVDSLAGDYGEEWVERRAS
jgi:hypothetical protein